MNGDSAPMTRPSSIRGEQPVLQTLGFGLSALPKIAPKFGDLGTTRESFVGSDPFLSVRQSLNVFESRGFARF
jgi:hypothetical protein